MRSPILYDIGKVNMKLRLIAKSPYITWSLEVTHSADDEKEYATITKLLLSIGWLIDPTSASPLRGVYTDHFIREGTGSFHGWTKVEEGQNLAALYRVLYRFNYPKPRQHRLTRMEQE